MISLRLIPMRICTDIIRYAILYHMLTHMISLRLIPMRIRADIIRSAHYIICHTILKPSKFYNSMLSYIMLVIFAALSYIDDHNNKKK